ncbi:hypothetical protein BH09MYX1_BH09MYX1_52480 [soil metagenome]
MRSTLLLALVFLGCGKVAEGPPDAMLDAASEETPWDPKDHLGECCGYKEGAGPLPADAGPPCPYPKSTCRPIDYCCWNVPAWEGGVLEYGCTEYQGKLNQSCLPGKPK